MKVFCFSVTHSYFYATRRFIFYVAEVSRHNVTLKALNCRADKLISTLAFWGSRAASLHKIIEMYWNM